MGKWSRMLKKCMCHDERSMWQNGTRVDAGNEPTCVKSIFL